MTDAGVNDDFVKRLGIAGSAMGAVQLGWRDLMIARAAGHELPEGDDGRLRGITRAEADSDRDAPAPELPTYASTSPLALSTTTSWYL